MLQASATSNMQTPRHSPGLMAGVALGHAGVALLLMLMQPVSQAVMPPRPLMVSLIEMPEEAEQPAPRPQQPKPVIKPRPQPPVLSAEKTAAAEPEPVVEAPKQPVEPLPDILPTAATVTEAPRPAPPPVIEPRFDANYLHNPKPPYPSLSNRHGEQGIVQLRVYVNADGSVGKLELKRSSGHPRLDQSAMNTVQNWRFVPARQGSQAVAAWVVVPINFTLGS